VGEYLKAIPPEKLLEAARAVSALRGAAFAELKLYQKTHKLRLAAERETNAYLDGVLHGLGAAYLEFEKRRPLEWRGS